MIRLSSFGLSGILPILAWAAEPMPVESPAQESPAEPQLEADGVSKAEAAKELEGLWPSDKMLRLMLTRWADDVGHQFDLDDDQRKQVEKDLVDRWTQFLKAHRDQLQPLLNEFIEMRMELTPPEKERVQAWSERALPVFEKVREQMQRGTEEFRSMLNPEQRMRFEAEALKFNAGLTFAESKLRQWREGSFDPDEFWEPTRRERRRRRAERKGQRTEEATTAKSAEPDDPIAREVRLWEEYVRDFVQRLQLDEGQRSAALSCLDELKGRALAHRDLHRAEIDKLEARIKNHSGSDAELAAIKNDLTRLYGPVDDMFAELRRRIEAVPTEAQRAHAAQREDVGRREDAPQPPPEE
jgi:hypothetical protein